MSVIHQVRTNHEDGSYGHVRVEHNETSVCDQLIISGGDSITLNWKQWAELAEFAEHRAHHLHLQAELTESKETSKHMTNAQVTRWQAVNRANIFEDRVNLARTKFYDNPSGYRLWPFDTEVTKALEERNEIAETGVMVGSQAVYKITPKGKVEHRRFTGESDS